MKKWYDAIKKAQSVEEIEEIRISVFGKKGVLAAEFAKMKTAPNEEKSKIAQELNTHKSALMNEL
ncbi:MAG: phenylalanine--tRNA ligase subunit alpha, partial [Sulfurimonas sp.]|nr:phenylalanine--tRNA ligase subunit alpha [Sulfurimonas sp.]